MSDQSLVDRLAALPRLGEAPRSELEWLAEHGHVEVLEPGQIVAPMGRRIDKLWVVVSGRITVRRDHGLGPRRVIEWQPGELTGMLPYSRMKGPPGDNFAETRSELLAIDERLFPEMINRCPEVTAQAVHAMVDRARSFSASELHDEKMASLGRLAAGLAHELNNPASATVRASKLLGAAIAESGVAARRLGAAGLDEEVMATVEALRTACSTRSSDVVLSAIQQADREDDIADWLEDHGIAPAPASALAESRIQMEDLDRLAAEVPRDTLEVTLRWIAADCTTAALAVDIERAAGRISELVGAVKRFTRMDRVAGPETVHLEPGLRDTLHVVAAKARAKGSSIALDLREGLRPVRANAGELNQVWLNLIDNALDAIPTSGSVRVRAEEELDWVVVQVIDDGPGIAPDVLPRVFDPFFTTKPPGQGTGLGLDIARRLVRSYRGDLTVASEPGRTVFTVRLPVDTGDPMP